MDLENGRRMEWLETNGLGGFASSTAIGLNTRRYHGLLMAATDPPVGRMLLLSKLEETLTVDGQRYDLSVNEYPGVIHPHGYALLKTFGLQPFPVFVYQVGSLEIEKRIFMVHGENTAVVEYELRSPEPALDCCLEIRPLIAFRDYHSTMHWNDAIDRSYQGDIGMVSLRPYPGCPALHLAHTHADVWEAGDWYYSLQYSVERDRGLDFEEDLFCPVVFSVPFRAPGLAAIIASTEKRDATRSSVYRKQEVERRAAVMNLTGSNDSVVRQLALSADQFIVNRGDLHTIIAGYPWFGDWGRDTMVALPGLTLATRRAGIARDILQAFAECTDQGMLPNRFPEAGQAPEYNTVDATLWFFEAIRQYVESTGDLDFVRHKLYAVLKEIVAWHLQGTRYGIHVDSEGLLACGQIGVQLTWMDAKVGDWVVTPRMGKPVEIQALWYNALCVLRDLAPRCGDPEFARFLNTAAARAAAGFRRQFWNAGEGCLYDVLHGSEPDSSLRPNQIIALSLPNRMLDPTQERSVLDTVERELVTPMGLRTLSPRDPHYRPRYEGGVQERDSAYHQGTVWPWLIGPFITAYLNVHGRDAETKGRARAMLQPLLEHLRATGLNQVSEIADGDPPHTPRGCYAQAWSVAELLRAYLETNV